MFAAVVLKAAVVAPPLTVSTLLVGVFALPAVPAPARLVVFVALVGTLVALSFGLLEGPAVRVAAGGRRLTPAEHVLLEQVLVDLRAHDVAVDGFELFAARRPGAPAAIARGRRTIIVAPEFIGGLHTGGLPRPEAAAVLAHAAGVLRRGLNRQDLLILLWSTPWRLLATVFRPFRWLFAIGWKARPLVLAIAVWQSATTGTQPHGQIAAVVITVLGCWTYLAPRWARSWEALVVAAGDQAATECGLPHQLARFLRRFPATPDLMSRIQRLERQPEPPRPDQRSRLRLIPGGA